MPCIPKGIFQALPFSAHLSQELLLFHGHLTVGKEQKLPERVRLKTTSHLKPQAGVTISIFPAWLAVGVQTWMRFQAEQSSRRVLRLDSAGIPRPFQYKPDADRHLGESLFRREHSTALSEPSHVGAVNLIVSFHFSELFSHPVLSLQLPVFSIIPSSGRYC